MGLRQDQLSEVLAQAGPKGKEALALAGRRTVEIHLHISGPIVVGSEVATILLPMLLKAAEAKTDK